MSSAINALLSESDDDEDEDLINDATQLLEEEEGSKPTGMLQLFNITLLQSFVQDFVYFSAES
jgi:hypothetical protein